MVASTSGGTARPEPISGQSRAGLWAIHTKGYSLSEMATSGVEQLLTQAPIGKNALFRVSVPTVLKKAARRPPKIQSHTRLHYHKRLPSTRRLTPSGLP